MRVLIACEFSGIVREAFRKKGHDAWSCDFMPALDNTKYHINGNVIDQLDKDWDMMIGHPPCTYLCAGSMNWLYREEGRYEKMEQAVIFFKALFNSSIPKVALENPIGILSSKFRKPDQIIKANYFGSEYRKDIALWLKGLPKLIYNETDNLFSTQTVNHKGTKKMDMWSTKRKDDIGRDLKSIFFPEVADAMANQWV